MDRATVSFGTEDRDTCVLDRPDNGGLGCTEGRAGDSSVRPPRADTFLPGSATSPSAGCPGEEADQEQAVVLQEVWSQLSVPERQRFGHCFSFMVLKALGLRPCSAQEVEL
jgi:hypothetical protein